MNWKGYTIEVGDNEFGHRSQITGRWKPDKYEDKWWWKCLDCVESSGVLSGKDLKLLKDKGFIAPPDPDEKDLTGDTRHPDESGKNDYCYYGDCY